MSRRPRWVRALRTGAALGGMCLAGANVGCDTFNEIGPTSCDRSADENPPVRYAEGIVTEGNPVTYQTSEFDGELLYFPGGMRYELEHGLGQRPDRWQAYLSFDRFGTRTGTVALAAGNQVELIDADDETLTVANGSCVEYWLLVVASAAAPAEN